ncbi:MAG: DNA methyltransferase [Polyangiaceae bacterium]
MTKGARDRYTFRGNLAASRHGWLRLTPAYSVHLVRELLQQHARPGYAVLDPFCGTGTTLLACAEAGLDCVTVDVNPFLVWLAKTKTSNYDAKSRRDTELLVAKMIRAAGRPPARRRWIPDMHHIERWWDARTLDALAAAAHVLSNAPRSRASALARVSFCRTLIRCSAASFGHQSMSFKSATTAKSASAARDVCTELALAHEGVMQAAASQLPPSRRRAVLGDARQLEGVEREFKIGTLITSPPYANRMSYIRELRPYMYWLRYLRDGREAGELDWKAIGGTWGIATSRLAEWRPAGTTAPRGLPPLVRSIAEHSDVLARYVARYFEDMDSHVRSAHARLEPGGTVHYIVGNSKFYDHVVPVEQLLARQLRSAGFHNARVTQLRKRTSKRELYEYLVSARKP